MRKFNLAIDLTKSAPPLHNMASHLPNTVPLKHYLEGAVFCGTPGLNRNQFKLWPMPNCQSLENALLMLY